jgi:glycosyltransferase involved in cell wall biosynthesis
MQPSALSIVVPTLNEAENLPLLLERIDSTLTPKKITYEVIIIDDHSKDNTLEIAKKLQAKYPVSAFEKRGSRGKAHSLLEGFDKCRYKVVAMIDADLQYPPEALADMHQLMHECGADVVVTDRIEPQVSKLRKLSTNVFHYVFTKLLFGLDFDTQSGLKMFKKEVLYSFSMRPSPWSFDLEFIVRSLENKYTVISYTIPFSERNAGDTKVKVFHLAYELSKASILLRLNTSMERIREGVRANNKFIRDYFTVAIATFASILILSAPSTTYATSNSGSSHQEKGLIGQITDTAKNVLSLRIGDDTPNSDDSTTTQPVVALATPPANTTQPTTTTAQASTPQSNTPTTGTTNQGTASPANSSTNTSQQTPSTQPSANNTTPSTASSATGNNSDDTYGSLPSNVITASTANTAGYIAGVLMLCGLVVTLLGALAFMLHKKTMQTAHVPIRTRKASSN